MIGVFMGGGFGIFWLIKVLLMLIALPGECFDYLIGVEEIC